VNGILILASDASGSPYPGLADMGDSGSASDFFDRLNEGRNSAIEDLFRRYVEKLVRLAQRGMDTRLRGRVDPEEVAQSAFGSVIRGIREERFRFDDERRLWSLLVTITLHKIIKRAASAGREDHILDWSELLSREPGHEEYAIFTDLKETVLTGLKSQYRAILDMKLAKLTQAEIADELGTTRAAVRYKLERLRERLQRVMAQSARD